MDSRLKQLSEHDLLKVTLCVIENKYGKQAARQAEIYLTNTFIMKFLTKQFSRPWSFISKEKCESNVIRRDFRDIMRNKYSKIEINNTNTNPKFPTFIQTIYTAGDKDDFIKYGIQQLKGKHDIKKILTTFKFIFNYMKKGIFVEIFDNKISVFLPINNANFRNDWGNLLKPEPLKTIQPKGKPEFTVGYEPGKISLNEINRNQDISRNAQLENQLETVNRYIQEGYPSVAIEAFERSPRKEVIKEPTKWYANNCFFRYSLRSNIIDEETGKPTGKDEYGGPSGEIDEGDKTIANFLELLAITCLHKKIKDSVFFMNYRDFPYLEFRNNKLINPFYSLYLPNNDIPYIKIDNDYVTKSEMIPVLSQSVSSSNSDTLFIDEDEIEEQLPAVTKPTCRQYKSNDNIIPWSKKKSAAVFRGAMTGCGTELSNQRLQLAAISYILEDFKPELNVKFVNISKRIKKDPLKEFVDYINPSKKIDPKIFEPKSKLKPFYLSKLIGSSLSDQEQSQYKYVFMVEGMVSPFRFSKQLSWGSLIIMIPSKWKLWFENKNSTIPTIKFGEIKNGKLKQDIKTIQGLKLRMISKDCKSFGANSLRIKNNSPMFQCPTISIIDINHLKETLKWCQKNDNLAKQIAEQGYRYYETYLNRKMMIEYVANVINSL